MIFLNEIYRKFGAYFTNITLGVGANWWGSLFEGGAYSKEGGLFSSNQKYCQGKFSSSI